MKNKNSAPVCCGDIFTSFFINSSFDFRFSKIFRLNFLKLPLCMKKYYPTCTMYKRIFMNFLMRSFFPFFPSLSNYVLEKKKERREIKKKKRITTIVKQIALPRTHYISTTPEKGFAIKASKTFRYRK